MAAYQGHRSWNAWNIALWIGNDETLYAWAMDCIESSKTIAGAARKFMRYVEGTHTPDGATYNLRCVREALAGLKD